MEICILTGFKLCRLSVFLAGLELIMWEDSVKRFDCKHDCDKVLHDPSEKLKDFNFSKINLFQLEYIRIIDLPYVSWPWMTKAFTKENT